MSISTFHKGDCYSMSSWTETFTLRRSWLIWVIHQTAFLNIVTCSGCIGSRSWLASHWDMANVKPQCFNWERRIEQGGGEKGKMGTGRRKMKWIVLTIRPASLLVTSKLLPCGSSKGCWSRLCTHQQLTPDLCHKLVTVPVPQRRVRLRKMDYMPIFPFLFFIIDDK